MEYQSQHDSFLEYLLSVKREQQGFVSSLLHRIEEDLPRFIDSYFETTIKSIYEITDVNAIDILRGAIIKNSVLKSLDRQCDEPSYTIALLWYRRFLQSDYYKQKYNNGPISVPGEDHIEKSIKEGRVLREGAEVQSEHVTHYERNQDARKACIEYYKERHEGRIVCECCGFDFSKAYPGIGEEYIEVHHLKPISQRGGEHQVVPEKDLVPLCSNCHSMIHRVGGQGDCMSLEELKSYYKGINYNKLT